MSNQMIYPVPGVKSPERPKKKPVDMGVSIEQATAKMKELAGKLPGINHEALAEQAKHMAQAMGNFSHVIDHLKLPEEMEEILAHNNPTPHWTKFPNGVIVRQVFVQNHPSGEHKSRTTDTYLCPDHAEQGIKDALQDMKDYPLYYDDVIVNTDPHGSRPEFVEAQSCNMCGHRAKW